MSDLNMNIRLANLFSFYGQADSSEFRKSVEELIESAVNEVSTYRPILEIRIPFWSGLKRMEFDTFYKNVKAVCDNKYLIFVLPMRNDKIKINLNPSDNFDREAFRQSWMDVMQGKSNWMPVTNEALVTDMGTIKVHSIFNTDADAHADLVLTLRAEMDMLLNENMS